MGTKYIPAGAGSGKTFKLTHDLAKMLTREDDPVEASRIILTTFTKSAAADFIRRAREVLITENHDAAKAAELDSALIGTVHSICERFIKKYWYRLDLNLPLNIMSDADRKLFTSRTAEGVASDDDIKFFVRFAKEFEVEPDFWKGCVESIIEKKYSFDVKDLDESCRLSCEDIDRVFSADVMLTDKKVFEVVFERERGILVLEKTATAAENLNKVRDILGRSLFCQAKEIRSIISVDGKPSVFGTQRNWKKLIESGFTPDELEGVYELAGDYVVSKEVGAKMKECVERLFKLARSWEDEYNAFKVENRLLDYNDLEQKFLKILEKDDFEDVRRDIRNSYRVMMVDEFQDSNPVQIKIFRKMTELVGAPEVDNSGKPVHREVEFVGDSKQAIYGFRGTESSLVNGFIEGIEDQEPLKESRRSRKELVKSANAVFCGAFDKPQLPVFPDDDSKPYDGVSLKDVRKEPEGMGPALQHWNTPAPRNGVKNNYPALGRKIHDLVESGTCMVVRRKDEKDNEIPERIQYGDIAILLRNGYNIGEVAEALQKAGVPVSILEEDFIGRAEVQLILSLVRYVSKEDRCAKADILHLIKGMTTEKVIQGSVTGQWDDDVKPFFKKLESIRSRVSTLSVSEIVDTLTLELDMYRNVRDWGMHSTRMRNIGFMASLAREYEEQCTSINLSPTLPGYISYVYGYKPEKRLVDKTNTVKVLTYHNAKGLDWPMVILDELDSFKTEDQEVIKKGYNGVCNFKRENEDEVLLHVFPKLMCKRSYGAAYLEQPLPDTIVKGIKSTALFDYVKTRKVEEERRLLYVGFTRAKDYLVTLGNSKSKYSWLTGCGAGCKDPVISDNGIALWHSMYPSAYIDISELNGTDDQIDRQPRAWDVPESKNYGDKYMSPSRHVDKVPASDSKPEAIFSEVFQGEKMVQNISGEDSAVEGSGMDNESTRCGTCIHRIFAAYDLDEEREKMVEMAGRIIEGMGLTNEFPSPDSVIDSAEQLAGWIRQRYGEGTPLHELPVLLKRDDGTIIRGDMDLVWELPDKKCILVDYKSYHGSEDLRDIKAYADKHGYPEQLKAYKETLESGTGQNHFEVTDALIYLFVLGKVVKIEF